MFIERTKEDIEKSTKRILKKQAERDINEITAKGMIPEYTNSFIKLFNVFEMSEEELLEQQLVKISD